MSERLHPKQFLPQRWYYFAVAAIPFLLGTLLLQLFSPPITASLLDSMEVDDGASFGHLGDRLTYATATLLQLATCVAVLCFHFRFIRQLDRAERLPIYRLLIFSLLTAAVVVGAIRIFNTATYQLTFKFTRELFLRSHGLPEQFAWDSLFLGQSRIFWASALPFIFGVTVIAVTAAVGAALPAPRDEAEGDGADWEAEISARMKRLQHSFRAASLVLVTSAIALMLFLRLPARLLNEAGQQELSSFTTGLTMFWGVVMTLTLFTGFVPPFLALRAEFQKLHQAGDSAESFDDWFTKIEGLSIKRHLTNSVTMLAPVLVGPIGSILQSMLGG